MTATLHRRETSATAASVLAFPRLVDDPRETQALSTPDAASTEFYEQLRNAIDAFVTQAYLKHLQRGLGQMESPFDAVYLSALIPDELEPDSVSRIEQFSDIKDLSETIRFEDEWGD